MRWIFGLLRKIPVITTTLLGAVAIEYYLKEKVQVYLKIRVVK